MTEDSTLDCDVLIIGGGLMGTTTAFFLRRQHGKSVTLLERELVGRQASDPRPLAIDMPRRQACGCWASPCSGSGR